MELSDAEIRELFTWVGTTTESIKNIEGNLGEHLKDYKQDQVEFRKEIKALSGEIGITKGERKYIYGLIAFLYTSIVGGFFAKLFKWF